MCPRSGGLSVHRGAVLARKGRQGRARATRRVQELSAQDGHRRRVPDQGEARDARGLPGGYHFTPRGGRQAGREASHCREEEGCRTRGRS